MRVAGFVKVRNEIIREGNLYRLLSQLEDLCDTGVICDDASTDGTQEIVIDWARDHGWQCICVLPEQHSFRDELAVKDSMMQLLHATHEEEPIDWILWLDGDELLDRDGVVFFRRWLEQDGHKADVWAFHYTQLWRNANFARVDCGFDEGAFWKLWRYRPDLSFVGDNNLHRPQFPTQYIAMAVAAAEAGGNKDRACRAPFEILHLGNWGKNLVWKAVQYCNSGALERASLERHLYFGQRDVCLFRAVDPAVLPVPLYSSAETPMPFSRSEIALLERMADLKARPGLIVVVVPTYNRGYLLDRTLTSVLQQTYENWVCVVLDDGSTDNTPLRMREWQDKDPRFFYCRYETNRGGVAMNEIGCALACEMGDAWVRLGSDDYFEPHKLELDIAAFNEGANVVYGPYRDLHETYIGDELRNGPMDARGMLLSRGFAGSWANMAVSTYALTKVRERHGDFCDSESLNPGPFPGERLRNMEDWLVNTRLAYLFEFTWRGLVARDGYDELVINARDLSELGNVHPSKIRADAVWRIGSDGASQKPETCNDDGAITMRRIIEMEQLFKPEPRNPPPTRSLGKRPPLVARTVLFSTTIPMPPPIAHVPLITSPCPPGVSMPDVPRRDVPWSLRQKKVSP